MPDIKEYSTMFLIDELVERGAQLVPCGRYRPYTLKAKYGAADIETAERPVYHALVIPDAWINTPDSSSTQTACAKRGERVESTSKNIQPTMPKYPIKLTAPVGVPRPLADILLGLYATSDAGEAATLASEDDWIICGVVWTEHPESWVLGRLKHLA